MCGKAASIPVRSMCRISGPPWGKTLRYTELNPVRAGLVTAPEKFPWSSAAVHCGMAEPDASLEMELWQHCWTPAAWRKHLAAGSREGEAEAIRESTHTGRPLGTPEFIEQLERTSGRHLAPQKGGRSRKPPIQTGQGILHF